MKSHLETFNIWFISENSHLKNYCRILSLYQKVYKLDEKGDNMQSNNSSYSNNMNQAIENTVFLNKHNLDNGVRLNDIIFIAPIYGRKRKITCKKTHYVIIHEDSALQSSISSNEIRLPRMKNEEFNLELSLCNQTTVSRNEQKSRYILKSKNKKPFRLNNQFVFSALLDRGDCVYIGDNKIIFSQVEEDKKCFSQFDLEKNKKLICSDLPILIQGETGTGKTHLAHEIHKASGALGPFVHINLSSFSSHLIESELFGHVKGAFTGAMNDKKGAFSMAQNGTLFIDEIDSLPLEIQTKLLLFLDNKKYRPVGTTRELEVTTRVVFSTGQCLKKLVDKKLMRKDFYFRLSMGQTIVLKSIRDNIKVLESFCEQFSFEKQVSLTKGLVDFYKTLPWPGNFRELKGHLEKKVILSQTRKLDFDKVDEQLITKSSELLSFVESESWPCLEEVKKEYCKKVYYYFNQNIKLSSSKLGINTKTLKRILGT